MSAISPFSFSDLVPDFSPEEIFSPELLLAGAIHIADIDFLQKLQRFRDMVYGARKCGLVVNHGDRRLRGFRSIGEQIKVSQQYGGAEVISMHCAGKAVDISLARNHDSEWLAARALEFGFTGVGQYPTFVHVDMRTLFDDRAPVQWIRG